MKKTTTVALLFGGASNEYEVSLRSAYAVYCHLPKDYTALLIGITKKGEWYLYSGEPAAIFDDTWHQKADSLTSLALLLSPRAAFVTADGRHLTPDVIFPVLHGQNCEDGRLQGLLDLASVPYVGCGCASSALGMDKAVSKLIAESMGIPVAKWMLVTRKEVQTKQELDAVARRIEERFSTYPIFVKAVNSGSSVGAYRANDSSSLRKALTDAAAVDTKILVEEFVCGKEIECAILDKKEGLTAFTPGEIEPCAEFYDYDTKYKTDSARYHIPARISNECLEKIRHYAAQIFTALGCRHLSRVDFFVTDDNRVIFNEINTLPGFTSISMYPKMAEAGGLSFEQLVQTLIEEALSS